MAPELSPYPVVPPALRPLERELLSLQAAGLTIVEAADALAYSEQYMRHIQAQVRRRFGARTSTHAVALAVAYGLVPAR